MNGVAIFLLGARFEFEQAMHIALASVKHDEINDRAQAITAFGP